MSANRQSRATRRTPRERRIPLGDAALAALQWGAGEPAAVLLHGAGDNAAIWADVARTLSYPNVVALDFRGHGQTTAPAVFDTATLAADVEHVVRSLELPAVTLIGHSWGANVAVEVAVRAGVRVRWLVLVEGGVGSFREVYADTETVPPDVDTEPPPARAVSAVELAQWVKDRHPIERAVVLRRHRSDGDGMIHPTPAEGLRRGIAAWSQPLTELCRQLPHGLGVTVIRAADRFADSTPRLNDAIKRHLAQLITDRPDFDVRWLPGGHALPAYEADALAALINDLAPAALDASPSPER